MTNQPSIGCANKPRPDGLDVDRYKNYLNWTYKRWAWEFLRRNPKYINACKKVRNGTPEQQQEVAENFGLKEFKSYTQPYKSVNSRVPKFIVGVPSIFYKKTATEDFQYRRIKLTQSQVLIRFDFQHANDFNWSIKSQVNRAIKVLEANGYTKTKSPDDITIDWFYYLIRLLDCVSKPNNTQVSCFDILNSGDDISSFDYHQKQQTVKNDLDSAKKIAEVTYRYYGSLKGKPTKKPFTRTYKSI